MQSSGRTTTPPSSRRNSGSSLSMFNDFSPEELLREVERREHQRRKSRDLLLDAAAAAAVVNESSKKRRQSSMSAMDHGTMNMNISAHNALFSSRNNSRDDVVDLYNQMRSQQHHTGGGGGQQHQQQQSNNNHKVRRANSLDSFSSLALMAGGMSSEGNTIMSSQQQALEELGGPHRNVTNNHSRESPGEVSPKHHEDTGTKDVVVIVPTAKPSSKLIGKQRSSPPSHSSEGSTVVTDTNSPRPGDKTKVVDGGDATGEKDEEFVPKKRNNSTASFDALLSVFGDELAELDREKNGGTVALTDDDKSAVSNASAGFFDKLMEKTAEATAAARQKDAEMGGLKDDNNDSGRGVKRRFSTSSSLSDYPNLNEKKLQQQHIGVNKDRVLSKMDEFLENQEGSSSSKGFISLLPNGGGSRTSLTDYSQKMQSTASMMSRLEAMRKEELVMKERALREGVMRENVLRMEQIKAQQRAMVMGVGGGSGIPRYAMSGGDAMMEQRLAMAMFGGGGRMSSSQQQEQMAADAMIARLQGFQGPMGGRGGQLHPDHPTFRGQDSSPLPEAAASLQQKKRLDNEKPENQRLSPTVALEIFLKEFGEPAEKAKASMLEAIADTEKSLVTIHAWDRSQGLRKCHSRTVVKTRRSRAKLKAFLNGLEPPKEPTKKRKKAKKVAVEL